MRSEIVKILCDESARSRIGQQEKIATPFDINSNEYLNFAQEDIEKNEPKHIVNSLSNAKRAIDSRLDTLLIGFTYYKKAQKKGWSVRTKLEKISEFGVIAPRIILRLNKKRNLLEHQFIKPNYEEVQDFIDVASLFIYATDSLVYQFPIGGVIVTKTCDQYRGHYVKLDYINEILTLHESFFMPDLGGIKEEDNVWADSMKSRKIYPVTHVDDDFDTILKSYINACTKINKD